MKTTLSLLSCILLSGSLVQAESLQTETASLTSNNVSSSDLSQASLVYAPEASKVLLEMKLIAKAMNKIAIMLPKKSSTYEESIPLLLKVYTNIDTVEETVEEAVNIGKESGVPCFDIALTEQQAHDEISGILERTHLLRQEMKHRKHLDETMSPQIIECLKTLAATTNQMTLQLTTDVDTLKKEHPRAHQGYHAAYFNKASVEAALDNILKPLEASENNL